MTFPAQLRRPNERWHLQRAACAAAREGVGCRVLKGVGALRAWGLGFRVKGLEFFFWVGGAAV